MAVTHDDEWLSLLTEVCNLVYWYPTQAYPCQNEEAIPGVSELNRRIVKYLTDKCKIGTFSGKNTVFIYSLRLKRVDLKDGVWLTNLIEPTSNRPLSNDSSTQPISERSVNITELNNVAQQRGYTISYETTRTGPSGKQQWAAKVYCA